MESTPPATPHFVSVYPTFSDRGPIAQEGKKRGLKGIFRIVLTTQLPSTNAEDHAAVRRHQRRECGFVSPTQKSPQQIRIGRLPVPIVADHLMKTADDGILLSSCHDA